LASQHIKVLAVFAIENICGTVPQGCPEQLSPPKTTALRRCGEVRLYITYGPLVAYLPGGTELRVREKSRHSPSARALIRLDARIITSIRARPHEADRVLTSALNVACGWRTASQTAIGRLEETAPSDRYEGLPQTQRTCPGRRGSNVLVCADPSGERVQHLYARLFEVPRVSRYDDETVNECSCRDQAILDRQRLAGSAQAGKKFCPTKTRLRVP